MKVEIDTKAAMNWAARNSTWLIGPGLLAVSWFAAHKGYDAPAHVGKEGCSMLELFWFFVMGTTLLGGVAALAAKIAIHFDQNH